MHCAVVRRHAPRRRQRIDETTQYTYEQYIDFAYTRMKNSIAETLSGKITDASDNHNTLRAVY